MTKVQKRKYETFVRVRDYGMAHKELFPESSQGGQAFGQMATIDDLLEARMLARAEARRVKSTTRAMVSESLKTIAHAARRAARLETENHPFHIPRRRSLTVVIATARTFIDAARKRQELFARFDLPPAFISDLEQLTDALQRNVDDRLSSKSTRSLTRNGIWTEVARGSELVRDLDVMVAVATKGDPARFAAWRSARLVEGMSSSATVKTAVPVPAAPDQPAAEPAPLAGPAVTRPDDDVMGRAS